MNKVIFYIVLAISFCVLISLVLPGDKDPRQVASSYSSMEYSSSVTTSSKLEFDKFRNYYLDMQITGDSDLVGNAEVPDGIDISQWITYTEASNLSDKRKKTLL